MKNKDSLKEAMMKVIEEKKAKSASQSGLKRSPESLGNGRKDKKKSKKTGGLFDR